MRFFVFFSFFLASSSLFAQYRFSGEVSQTNAGNTIYLSLVEDYRKSSRIYLDQIVKKAQVDSLGHFQFEGNNLPLENRIYRIHLDGCSDSSEANHFLGQCNNSSSVLFIANNTDTVQFPTSFEDQSLCSIISTNAKSEELLQVEFLKDEMAFDFMEYTSEASRKLNSKKWFATLQDFGKTAEEPLVELFVYDFLSDKRNETYAYYLQDVPTNLYYENLLNRLQSTYPEASFTQQYAAEIATDKELATFNTPKTWYLKYLLQVALILSLLANVYLLTFRKLNIRVRAKSLREKLTPQEQKIVQHILQEKSNKEIATELFVSLSTVKTHINNLYKKLEVSSREEIVLLFKK
ncbi:response regulator transcription factor [Muricauda sp. CAU 1633]|uniref:response regulator transcription factor n=1 Tax=Allomuricauda sp. CAU 1633 TaxID=2816036 RepID=UPI001A8C560E|nr:LuxR C-terminal-related transcriptional regulator [Muricauda sp. CAU 1633]MBO0321614.1 response regulator transcription factor [Muricauda sp. CAU 1633]